MKTGKRLIGMYNNTTVGGLWFGCKERLYLIFVYLHVFNVL